MASPSVRTVPCTRYGPTVNHCPPAKERGSSGRGEGVTSQRKVLQTVSREQRVWDAPPGIEKATFMLHVLTDHEPGRGADLDTAGSRERNKQVPVLMELLTTFFFFSFLPVLPPFPCLSVCLSPFFCIDATYEVTIPGGHQRSWSSSSGCLWGWEPGRRGNRRGGMPFSQHALLHRCFPRVSHLLNMSFNRGLQNSSSRPLETHKEGICLLDATLSPQRSPKGPLPSCAGLR